MTSSQSGTPSSASSDDMLLNVERALVAFDPRDGDARLQRLLTGLLNFAGVVDHPPMLVARAVQEYSIGVAGAVLDQDRDSQDDEPLPPELAEAAAFTEVAGRVIGALWYLAAHVDGTDPMQLQAAAHRHLQVLLDDEAL